MSNDNTIKQMQENQRHMSLLASQKETSYALQVANQLKSDEINIMREQYKLLKEQNKSLERDNKVIRTQSWISTLINVGLLVIAILALVFSK